MHPAAFSFVASVARRRPPGLVVDIGSRNINGSVRPLFDGSPYLGIDLVAGDGVDIVADGATWQPPTAAACVVCCEVLEHTPNADAICRHAFDILTPDGCFIVTAASRGRQPHSGRDGGALADGEYYRNVDAGVLSRWLEPFAAIQMEVDPDAGDVYAFARRGND